MAIEKFFQLKCVLVYFMLSYATYTDIRQFIHCVILFNIGESKYEM